MAIRLPSVQWPGHCTYIAALALLDRGTDAERALVDLMAFRPDISLSFVRRQLPTIVDDDLTHILDGLRKACLAN